MRHGVAKVGVVTVGLVLATALALLSVLVEQTGPEVVQQGNLCGPSANEPCYKPVLKGGFPYPFLFDAPGVSREGQLAFFEDNLNAGALLLDILAYFAAIMLCVVTVSSSLSISTHASSRTDA
jgi:hypothetical protein